MVLSCFGLMLQVNVVKWNLDISMVRGLRGTSAICLLSAGETEPSAPEGVARGRHQGEGLHTTKCRLHDYYSSGERMVSTVDWSVASWSLDSIRGIDFKQIVKGVQ